MRRGIVNLLYIGLFILVAVPGWAFDPGAKKSSIAETDIAKLKPGEFIWLPGVAPAGPMTIVVNLKNQRAYVYRNGVRIGASTISSGKKGHETPTGVFTILQKNKDHRSNLYNNAPMPYMQRLTWDGIALHAGGLPGYPASHGCVRLPMTFATALFKETKTGMTVIVTDEKPNPHTIFDPGLVTAAKSEPRGALLGPQEQFRWTPELSPNGPVTILISYKDQRILVLRGGKLIGRAKVEIPQGVINGTHALQMLGTDAAGEPQWFYVGLPGHESGKGQPLDPNKVKQVRIPPEFRTKVLAILGTGVTMMATEDSFAEGSEGAPLTVLTTS